jgi:uncharacterized protein (DUF433 family)
MVQTTEQHYIVRNPNILSGEPIIQGTRTPVRAIVEMWRLGVAPEEIPIRLPHLTMAKVFAALSYYSDHQAEINEYIERNHVPAQLTDTRLEFPSREGAVHNGKHITASPLIADERVPSDEPFSIDEINDIVHGVRQQRRRQIIQ